MRHKPITYNIHGQPWEFYLIPTASYRRKFGTDSAAICLLKEKQVWFHKSEFTLDVIAHEIMHILFAQSPHGSAELNGFQTEEVAAEIIHNTWNMWAIWVPELFRLLHKL